MLGNFLDGNTFMTKIKYRTPYNFYGLEKQTYKKSQVIILPVPYEGTVSYQKGAGEGPQAILTASRQVEWYDIELQKEIPEKVGIFTLPELEPMTNSPQEMIERVKLVSEKSIKDKKFQIMLGGEHSITLGAVQSFKKKYKDISILQIDAHSDLRDTWEGSKFNHACVMRRCSEIVPTIVQVGIRSQDKSEADFISTAGMQKRIFYAKDVPIKKILPLLTKNVYLTIDLDSLDPSIMPATGTPEPGGLSWETLISLIKEVSRNSRIVGADVVELAPIPGIAAPDFLAAKIVHKIIGYSFFKKYL